jgi:hypothetical protein
MKGPDDFVNIFSWITICRDLSKFFLRFVHYEELFHQAVVDVELDNGILDFKR